MKKGSRLMEEGGALPSGEETARMAVSYTHLVSLRQVERKVDLEASPILGRLRQAIRGGSAEA